MSRQVPKPTGVEQLDKLSKQTGLEDDVMSARMLAIIYEHATSKPISPVDIMGMIDTKKVSPKVGFTVLEEYDKFIKEVADMDPSSSAHRQLKDEHTQLVDEIGVSLSVERKKPQNQKLWEQLSELADDFSRHLSKVDRNNPLSPVFRQSG
jgi:hypothetical protein